ncbi:MAG: hypothetical protein ACOYMV_13210, partial [Verrucomicrobiia bacterium]
MSHSPSTTRAAFAHAALLVAALLLLAARPSHAVYAAEYDQDLKTLNYAIFLNDFIGAMTFYNNDYWGDTATIANIEGGWVWNGHETLSQGQVHYLPNSTTESSLTNWHATMVGHLLAGRGAYIFDKEQVSLSKFTVGIAPFSTLWSGAIATNI